MAKKLNLEEERNRLDQMKVFEREYKDLGVVCGIDEAGRGPLAGPVVAAAVILPLDCEILYLNDSKKVTERRREILFNEIREKAISFGIGLVEPDVIDKINILQATYQAMRMAVEQLSIRPDVFLNDAVTIPNLEGLQVPIIKGDAKSVSIAAASILAKVTRDHYMKNMDSVYPEYGFARHKGYGTAAHTAAIKTYGPSPIHRKTFIQKIWTGNLPADNNQGGSGN